MLRAIRREFSQSLREALVPLFSLDSVTLSLLTDRLLKAGTFSLVAPV